VSEFKLYRADKTLWACLLFMKYTNKKPEWDNARCAIRDALGEDGMARLADCWKEARKEGLA
jgi:hypothetical protein